MDEVTRTNMFFFLMVVFMSAFSALLLLVLFVVYYSLKNAERLRNQEVKLNILHSFRCKDCRRRRSSVMVPTPDTLKRVSEEYRKANGHDNLGFEREKKKPMIPTLEHYIEKHDL